MKNMWIVLTCLTLAAPVAWTQSGMQEKLTIDLASAYEAADTNNDNCLTLDEALLYAHKISPVIPLDAQVRQLFTDNDKNNDACISREEAGLPPDPGTEDPGNGSGCTGCNGSSAAKGNLLTLLFGLLSLAVMTRTGRV